MGKRPASSKATRGASKGKRASSSSSNPKINKFRSQYNNLDVIARGGPSKKNQNRDAIRKLAKDATERKKLLNSIESINMLEVDKDINNDSVATSSEKKIGKRLKNRKFVHDDNMSNISSGTQLTTASFASVWSSCTNASLNEFFQVWNPNLETHKDALSVIAGLSQIMNSTKTEQSDLEYTKTLFTILASPDTPINILTGAVLASTFVIRKLSTEVLNANYDHFYPVLKNLLEQHHASKKKSLVKYLIRCIASLTKVHPLGKEAIESSLRKKINIAIRKLKVQDKIRL